jgi:hypothetical protein
MRARAAARKGGFAAAACVACCAPPLIATLGVAAGLAVVAAVFVGLAAAIGVVLVAGSWIIAKRRSPRSEAPAPVAVAAPTRRIESPPT